MDEVRSRVVDTHISTVVMVDGLAVKRKRPVRTEFLDFSTLALRADACEKEVALNRRLSPDVYLGVADLVLDGEVLDHLVVMRRLPEHRRLSALLDDDEVPGQLRELARLIADFHASARRGPDVDQASGPDALLGLWEESVEQLTPIAKGIIDPAEIERVGALASEYIEGRRALIDRRVREGRACDGHGDLQADDVFCLPDGPRVLDCLEFADRLRHGDVLADVAFLAMDLERLGHPELGRTFLDAYRSCSGDSWPASLEHHHIAYRAHVRAKVACIRWHQGSTEAEATARRLHALARHHLEAGRVRMVLVGGSPGTGKSSVAVALGLRIGAVVLSSDRVRDEIDPRCPGTANERLDTGRYAAERIDAVYDELLGRAEELLRRGEHVVLDASWLDPGRRRRARDLARRTACHLTELRCTCPRPVAEQRIARRLRRADDASEVTVELARAIAAQAPPWPEARELDTTIPLSDAASVADVLVHRREVGTWDPVGAPAREDRLWA